MALKTDYKDEIPNSDLREYQMIQNANGTVSFIDVTEYFQAGDPWGAKDINETNEVVNEKFDSGDVVDPMVATEEGFAADALKTKEALDEQNKKFIFKTFEIDNISVKINNAVTKTLDISVEGYTPIQLINASIHDASTNGGGCSYGTIHNPCIEENMFSCGIHCWNASITARLKVRAVILYEKM